MITVVLIVTMALHAVQFFLHGLQKRFNNKFIDRVAGDVDRVASAAEGIADKLEPETSAVVAGAKAAAPIIALALGAGLLFGATVMLTGCGGADLRNKVIEASLATVDTARGTFLAWEHQHEIDLANNAPDDASADAALKAYRKARAPVVTALEDGYRAIAAAALVDATEDDQKKLQTALGLITDALKSLGVTP